MLPWEQMACEQVPPPLLVELLLLEEVLVPLEELLEVLVLVEELLLEELVEPPPAMAAPLGVPRPVGPSYPAPAVQRYLVVRLPLVPVVTS